MVLCPIWHVVACLTGLGKVPDTYHLLFGGVGFALAFLAGTVAAWSLLVGNVVRQGAAGAMGKARALSWGTLVLDGLLVATLVLTEAREQLLAGPEVNVARSATIALPFVLVFPGPVAWIAYFRCSVGAAEDHADERVGSPSHGSLPDSLMRPAAEPCGAMNAQRSRGRRLGWRAALVPVAVLTALAVGDPAQRRPAPQDREDHCLHELSALWDGRLALVLVGALAAGFLVLLLLQWRVGR